LGGAVGEFGLDVGELAAVADVQVRDLRPVGAGVRVKPV
jgi:hypothetical protein